MDLAVRYNARGARLEVRAPRKTVGGAPVLRTFAFGQRAITVRNTGYGEEERYALTEENIRDLLLAPRSVRAVWAGEGIRLGPAIAIYALPFSGRDIFGPQTSMFIEMSELCRRAACDLYVVTPGNLHPDAHSVEGYRYNAREWRKETCPWPDFVWRRLTARPLVWARQLDDDERQLGASPTHVGTLPRSDNDKWQVYQTLRGDRRSARYLPSTVVVRTPAEAARATDQFDDMYIKPTRGTQGRQVMRVRRTAGGFLVEPPAAGGRGRSAGKLQSMEDLARALGKRMWSGQAYLAQETIALMHTAAGRPFDLRVLVQAAVSGEPVCTAVVARIAKQGSVTTNLHTGGVPLAADATAALVAPAMRRDFGRGLEAAGDAALAVFDVLGQFHRNLVELGIDVALDTSGRAYVLEVNPCPGRRMLRQIDPALRRMSLVRVVEYAVFSTGFGPL